ncbi:MAG: excinuclease ABC subunit UvrC [bacterium]
MDIQFDNSQWGLREKLDALPLTPGVYQFKNSEGKVIYVGKAQNLRSRVRQYFHKSRLTDPKTDALVGKIRDLEIIVTDSEIEALILEANLIKKLKPRYNVILKDDKSFPYIIITNEPFPRVFVTRRIVNDGSRYFGPYTDVRSMRSALKTVRDIFMIRSCNYDLSAESITAGKFKICLDYHIKKCDGPCEGYVTREKYHAMIEKVAQILRGKTESVVVVLHQEMEEHAGNLRFEDAAMTRDRLRALSVYSQRQKVLDPNKVDRDILGVALKDDDAFGVVFRVRDGKLIGSRHFAMANVAGKEEGEILETLLERYYLDVDDMPDEIVLSAAVSSIQLLQDWLSERYQKKISFEVPKAGEKYKLVGLVKRNAEYLLQELELQLLKRGELIPHSVQSLQRDLRLPAAPRRIECFDISNIQGSDTVASLVVFVDAKPKKSEYRKFRIRTVQGPDDFASMQEVIRRRYTRVLEEKETLPDLIMIDGGKGQLSSAVEVLENIGIHTIPSIGLAKRLEEIFLPAHQDPIVLPRTSSSLRLLQQIRDEAHRFAITYHRTVRSKRILNTELDLIRGIGKKRAQELLEAFGSVQGVRFASEEQLSEIVGAKVSQKIKEYFAESIPDVDSTPRSLDEKFNHEGHKGREEQKEN